VISIPFGLVFYPYFVVFFSGGDRRLSVRKAKAEKDPNKPKRPPSAFFVFM
jgi:hypothetical protein